MSSIWGKLNEPTSIQLTSSVPGEAISKSRIRQQVWDFLEDNDLVNFPRPVHKRIPNFKGAAEAGQLVASLPEFKNASVVKVNLDKPQEEVRYQVLDHKKTLLVPTPRLKNGLFSLLENPENSDKEHQRLLASRQGIDNNSKPLPLMYKTNIDVVIIGSVAVDKLGHRIGKGEGFADLEFAMGASTGAITMDTVVIVTVHDCQLFNSFPEEIFGEHDVSADIIVTPTIIHRVEKRLPKPTQILWDMLSMDKLKRMPVLKQMKGVDERQEIIQQIGETGEGIQKEKKNKNRNISNERKHKSDETTGDVKEEKEKMNRRKKDPKDDMRKKQDKNKINYNKDKPKIKGDQGQKESGIGDTESKQEKHSRSGNNGNNNNNNNLEQMNREREELVYDDRHLLYVGKVPRNARVKDLKEALQQKEVKVKQLVWKGFKGYAFLYFDVSEDIENIYDSLRDLKIGEKELDIQREKYFE